jgi:hypothetical protein
MIKISMLPRKKLKIIKECLKKGQFPTLLRHPLFYYLNYFDFFNRLVKKRDRLAIFPRLFSRIDK